MAELTKDCDPNEEDEKDNCEKGENDCASGSGAETNRSKGTKILQPKISGVERGRTRGTQPLALPAADCWRASDAGAHFTEERLHCSVAQSCQRAAKQHFRGCVKVLD